MKLVYETALSIYKAVCSDSAKQSVNSEWPDYLPCFSVQLCYASVKARKTVFLISPGSHIFLACWYLAVFSFIFILPPARTMAELPYL